jgi:hypothetical protein
MSRILSFPQVFALNKGANYKFNACFIGLPIKTLTSNSGYQFTQPSFTTPAPNLYENANTTYTLASSTSTLNSQLIYKTGGNLTNFAIKWTNGKSLYNWYQIQRQAATPTGGSVSSNGKILRISCGPSQTLLNRSLIHDVKYTRAGIEILETSNTVNGYLQLQDTIFASVYFKGYVEPFDYNIVGLSNKPLGYHTQFFIGYRYFHTQNIDGNIGSNPLPIYLGTAKGFGFVGVRVNSSTFTWHCVVIASTEASTSESVACFSVNTNLSIFSTQKLQVTFDNTTNNKTITWYANGNQVATTSISTLEVNGHGFDGAQNPNTGNPMYANITSAKGGNNNDEVPSGSFTICVEEASVVRSNVDTYNNFEPSLNLVSNTEIEYHDTGLYLLKKLK